MVEWQMGPRQIAQVIGCDRNTVNRLVQRWGFGDKWKYKSEWAKKEGFQRAIDRMPTYKDGPYSIVPLDREKVRTMILADLTINQIAGALPAFTYEQIYDTILCDYEFNPLYRQHGQIKAKKKK
jgi:IS30 family transposase